LNKRKIDLGNTSLGIELGSTRIKGVLIHDSGEVLSVGNHDWENQLIDGIWTYDLKDVWKGVQDVYAQIKADIENRFETKIEKLGSIGFSAMMHGYLPFDKKGNLLVPFRTWRNAITAEAEKKLTSLFKHNIPQRWSIAHLYQAILNEEEHVSDIDFITTLAGYVHWKLTDEKVLGINDASGMFPIDSTTHTYNQEMLDIFDGLLVDSGFDFKTINILPTPLMAGELAGRLTQEGALLLDPSGDLKSGIPLAPPEGDAGTGMIATNAIRPRTGNISAGTSVFAMFVLEKPLEKVYPEIDIVTTPAGESVAMVHVNNCTTEINAWVNLFGDFAARIGSDISSSELYETLFNAALESDEGLEGVLTYGYHSGENITGLDEGRPLVVRKPDAKFTLANFMRSLIESAFATLSIGMRILYNENIKIESIVGHGGIFKTEGVAQRIVANALKSKLVIMDTASEGGAWGMAVLAQYLIRKEEMSLNDYLNKEIFDGVNMIEYSPSKEEIETFEKFVLRYEKGLEIEKSAVKHF